MAWFTQALGMVGGEQEKQRPQYVLPQRKPVEGLPMRNILSGQDLATQVAQNEARRKQEADKEEMMQQDLMSRFMLRPRAQQQPSVSQQPYWTRQSYSPPSSAGYGARAG